MNDERRKEIQENLKNQKRGALIERIVDAYARINELEKYKKQDAITIDSLGMELQKKRVQLQNRDCRIDDLQRSLETAREFVSAIKALADR